MRIAIHTPITFQELGNRDKQEDTVYPAPGESSSSDRLFVLCDGMGGLEAGEVASKTVCDTIVNHVKTHWQEGKPLPDTVLTEAVKKASNVIESLYDGNDKGMGTTLTIVALHAGGCTALHIGDSRIYHLRTAQRQWAYISRDHSLAFDLYQSGEISYEEMRTFPRRNLITKAISAGQEVRPRPDIVHIGNLQPGDYLFLCSDGILEQMEDDELLQLLCAKDSDQEKAQRLIEMTKDNNDNHSAHLIRIKQVTVGKNEKVADDERTTRCNALNVKPRDLANDRENKPAVRESDKPAADDDHITKQMAPPRRRLPVGWIWLALAIVALAVALFFVFSKPGKDDKQGPPAKEKIEIHTISHGTNQNK